MPEVWVTAIGVAVAAAGTAYSINAQNDAIKAANNAHPRPFVPIDINKTAQMAFIADKSGYDISDADWQKRFPQLAAGRDYNINDVAGNLSGVTSPIVTNTLDRAGLSSDLGGDQYKQSKNLGRPILALEQRGRKYFQEELGDNPARFAGLTGANATNIAVANTGNQANYTGNLFQSNIAKYNSSIQQNMQNTNAAISGLGSLAGLLSQNQQQDRRDNPLYGDFYQGAKTAGQYGGYG